MDNIVDKEDCIDNKKRKSLIKVLPSAITITAFCFGLSAIRFALFNRWEPAVFCVFVSALLDAFDGRVARMLGQSSQLGAELDSLSDLVCFGVAPSIILFLRSMYLLEGIGWAICMFFTVCCALRLARFNATLLSPIASSPLEKKFFTGVPAPAGAMIALLPMTLVLKTSNISYINPSFIAICLLFAGIMMISTLRTFSSKMIVIDSNSAVFVLIGIAMCVICVITDVWLTLSVFSILYVVSIPFGVCSYKKKKQAELSTETMCLLDPFENEQSK